MEVKGAVTISIVEFIKRKHASRYDEWLDALPPESRKIMNGMLLNTYWYPIKDGCDIPSKVLCDLFYEKDIKGAWEAGRFSAEYSLKGIYKLFLKLGSPQYILQKASVILPTYYRPSDMQTLEVNNKKTTIQVTDFEESSPYIEHRTGGWIEKALELSGCKELSVIITKSISKGDSVTEYVVSWS